MTRSNRLLMRTLSDPTYAEVVRSLKEKLLALKQELDDNDEFHPQLMEIRAEYS